MKRDLLAWAAFGAALAATASAEYELARTVGFNPWVAAAVPGALDVYTVRALRARRDVLAAIVAMIAVNAASHLVAAGLLPVSVPLVVAVSAIAPLVLWRVHRLGEHLEEPSPEPAVLAVPEAYPPVEVHRDTPAPERVAEAPKMPVLGPFTRLEELPRITTYPAVYPGVEQDEHDRAEDDVPAPDTDTATPDTPPRPTAYEAVEDELTTTARMDFQDLLDEGRAPSIRVLRDTYSIGQPRAQRIQGELIRS